jgi:hypothetical protein
MEKRSRRRIRDLVTQPAYQGLSENEIGCARISMMARSTNAPFTGRIQKRKTNHLHPSLSACNTRPVHTVGSFATGAFSTRSDQCPLLLVISSDRRNTLSKTVRDGVCVDQKISSKVHCGREDGVVGSLAASGVAESDRTCGW